MLDEPVAQTPVTRRAPRRRPLVDEIRDLIMQEFITNGATPAGELLPSEKELCARYGISRVTLRTSMRSLQDAGLIRSQHGIGWVVLTRALRQSLEQLSSLETFARETGQTVTTEEVAWSEIPADDALSEMLELEIGESVVVAKRIKVFNGTRAALLADFVPTRVLSLQTLKSEFEGSILDVLLSHGEIGLEYADLEIEARLLPDDVAELLHVQSGVAAQFLHSVARSADGAVVEAAETWLLPTHFRLSVRRRRL